MRGFRVSLPTHFEDVPAKVKAHLRASLEEVAESLASLPKDDLIWASMAQSDMHLDIGDWRFVYAVDREQELLVVGKAYYLIV